MSETTDVPAESMSPGQESETTTTTAPAEILAPPVTEVREETTTTAPPEILAPPQTVVRETTTTTAPAEILAPPVTEVREETSSTAPTTTETLPSVNITVDDKGEIKNASVMDTNSSAAQTVSEIAQVDRQTNTDHNSAIPGVVGKGAAVVAAVAGTKMLYDKFYQQKAVEKSRQIVDETPQS